MKNNFSDLPLADIHLPDAPGYWPLAPGWWILIGIIILIGVIFFIWLKRKKREAYRQQALIEFKKIEQEFLQDQNSAKYLQSVSLLLKRTALTSHPQNFTASTNGDEWLKWLDEQHPKRRHSFNSEQGQALIIGQYQKAPVIQLDQFTALITDWIKRHNNQWQKKSMPGNLHKEQKDV